MNVFHPGRQNTEIQNARLQVPSCQQNNLFPLNKVGQVAT